MRTLIFILGGFVLLAACLGVAKLVSSDSAGSMRVVTIAFLTVWLVFAAVNMWAGVARAGYSVTDELPIFLLIFGLPAAAAVFVKWKFY
jgi:hypothetical protein